MVTALLVGAYIRVGQVQLHNTRDRDRVVVALVEAYERLESPACRLAFGPEHELTQDRLTQLVFLDGSKDGTCRGQPGTTAWTPISAREVTLCPRVMKLDLVLTILHEAFHTMGLTDEEVGGSEALSKKVRTSCGGP